MLQVAEGGCHKISKNPVCVNFMNTPKGNKVRKNNMLQNSFKSIPGKMVVFVDQNIYSNFIHFISWIWVPRGFCPTNWDQDFMKVGILEKNSPSFFWHRQESVRITRVGIYQLCFLSAKVSVEGKQPSFRVGGACEKNYHFAKNHQNWKTRNFMFVKNWKKCLI